MTSQESFAKRKMPSLNGSLDKHVGHFLDDLMVNIGGTSVLGAVPLLEPIVLDGIRR